MEISPIAMVRLDVRRTSRLMSLDSASPLEKGLDPKPFVTKTGSCANKSVGLLAEGEAAALNLADAGEDDERLGVDIHNQPVQAVDLSG